MKKYQRALIYKIVSSQISQCYIGYTIHQDLNKILSDYKTKCYRWFNNCSLPYAHIFEVVVYDDAKIELIQKVYFTDKDCLMRYLSEIIKEYGINCVNLQRNYADKSSYGYNYWVRNRKRLIAKTYCNICEKYIKASYYRYHCKKDRHIRKFKELRETGFILF
jgi:hypothetical protein